MPHEPHLLPSILVIDDEPIISFEPREFLQQEKFPVQKPPTPA